MIGWPAKLYTEFMQGAFMGELALLYQARRYSTGIVGRPIFNSRNHHLIAENTDGDAVGAGEFFALPLQCAR